MMRSAIVRPTASSCDHPNTSAARSFQSATTPSDCMTTTASRAVSKIRRSPSLAEDRLKRLDSALVMTDMLEPSLRLALVELPKPPIGLTAVIEISSTPEGQYTLVRRHSKRRLWVHSRPGPTSSRSSPRPLFADRYRGGKPLKLDGKGHKERSRPPCSLR